ncbi:mas-related G-protein coupled receptor member H-like [Paroedura picta]|uniref:mas-related G-protein coupled receptor member H-like n=1 Tax=Paroedura picta TaxID=143630 RepID=UPI004055E870
MAANILFSSLDHIPAGLKSFNVHYSTVNRNVIIIIMITLVISVLGTVGNGVVIWLLGFRIKRNPFMTYILNLAVADFGVLLLADYLILDFCFRRGPSSLSKAKTWSILCLFMYSASQYLLTAISIDRCVAVFFPVWHQCKRPWHLSTIVCALIWMISALVTAITSALVFYKPYERAMEKYYQLILNAVVCFPVMAVASVSLFIKVCLKARQPQRGRLLTIVLLTLLFFLLCAFPYNVIFILEDFGYLQGFPYIPFCGFLLGCLNSSINPVIYFLVGSKWKSRRRENLKMVLQKVFKEEEGCTEETPSA